ncbi:hypothetical protein GCM10011521_08200 [Arenimonas soli]|uniref:DUF1684 domain-containing protein n=1 Tax=Arenimonas soli TaxID=2269504 RepID=A0ABQ1HF60_9GAMM|nr:DUF1684 domain-containing protein [Arenimonas soli]GGA72422.1 hypothetical protein GCM10011521_08200 [Arenimonas soli]
MRSILLPGLALSAALAGCGGGDGESTAGSAGAEQSARNAYEREIRAWREERVERLVRPDGFLSLVGLHWVGPGSTFVGSAKSNGTRLTLGPPQLGMLHLEKDGRARLDIAEGAEVWVDGEPATGSVELVSDARGKPTVVAFNRGDASFLLIERSGRHALRVRNAMASTRTGFPGIDYFDIDPAFRFQARFQAHPPGKTLDIVNMLGMVEPMANPGRVSFEKDGVSYSLEALDEGDGRLFFVFADRTSGHETYAASRFLYAEPAGADGLTVLDFNRAYNPPCAFTAYSTCPMPPPENRLDLRIEAGEKKPLPFPR